MQKTEAMARCAAVLMDKGRDPTPDDLTKLGFDCDEVWRRWRTVRVWASALCWFYRGQRLDRHARR